MELAIISGGQTGVDRAALDVAWELKLARGGWCPRGRLAEDGPLSAEYDLVETPEAEPEQRTAWNVRDSEATLILTVGEPTGGTRYTVECCRSMGKPHLVIDFNDSHGVEKASQWINHHDFRSLNVAGPRESTHPGIYTSAKLLLREILQQVGGVDGEATF